MESYLGMTLLICGFPGIGKSFLKKKFSSFVSDSDSSTFAKDNFPENYVDAIESALDEYPIDRVFLISTHTSVRSELAYRKLSYVIVYPKKEDKQIYLKRYQNRGSSENFVNLLDSNWDSFIESCDSDPTPYRYRLCGDQYLEDVFKQILLTHWNTYT
jgi:hypothetical protein